MAAQQPDRHCLGSTAFPAHNVQRIIWAVWAAPRWGCGFPWHPGIRPSCRGPTCSRAARTHRTRCRNDADRERGACGAHGRGNFYWRGAVASGCVRRNQLRCLAPSDTYTRALFTGSGVSASPFCSSGRVPLVGNALRVHTHHPAGAPWRDCGGLGNAARVVRGVRVRHHDGRAIRDVWTLARGSGARTVDRSRATTPGHSLSLRRSTHTLLNAGLLPVVSATVSAKMILAEGERRATSQSSATVASPWSLVPTDDSRAYGTISNGRLSAVRLTAGFSERTSIKVKWFACMWCRMAQLSPA